MIEMPEGAQLVADKFGFGRPALDAYALASHQRAVQAWDTGRFGDEVVAVPTSRGSFEVDETFRRDTSLESLASLAGYYQRRRGTRYGIAALCVGAGQGIATLVRNLDA